MELRYCDTRRDLMGTFGHRNVGLDLHEIFDFSTLHKFDSVSFHKDIIIFAYYPFFLWSCTLLWAKSYSDLCCAGRIMGVSSRG